MKAQNGVIEGTAREDMAKLANIPTSERILLIVGGPSLSIIAQRSPAMSSRG